MKKYLPFTLAAALLLLLIGLLELMAFSRNGQLCYPLDDAFIHMSVAKSLALHNVWGLTPNEWVSSSSSPLYTIVLALCFRLFGVQVYWPLVISLVGGLLVLLEMQRELIKHTALSPARQFWCLLLTMLVIPLPFLSLLGMEHTLQILLTYLFVHKAVTLLMNREAPLTAWLSLALWGALMVTSRYENVFVVAVVCGLLALQKRIVMAAMLGILCALPLLAFGWYMYSHGGYFFPNSVLLKGKLSLITLLNDTQALLELAGLFSGLLVIAGFVLIERFRQERYDRSFWQLLVFLLCAVLHACVATSGWLYRYEAYLVAMGAFPLCILLMQWWEPARLRQRMTWVYACVFGLFVCNLVPRALNSIRHVVRTTGNIYDQQYQMGKFLEQYYPGATIAANDVGAISFFGNIHTLDLWGLGSNEVTRARRENRYNTAYLHGLMEQHQAKVAIIYDRWFTCDMASGWYRVATWTIPNNYICADETVSFYATTQEEADLLLQRLRNFQQQKLPRRVTVQYYREPGAENRLAGN